jgi:hypothetical protein
MIPVPAGSLVERLEQIAALHERNGRLCVPEAPLDKNKIILAARHARIHEVSAETIREALVLLRSREASEA